MTKKRALLSVSDKTGVAEFAAGLQAIGYELVSTGGTARALREAGLPCTEVAEITGFPECLDGRVKTLHPAIHAGLLAVRGNPAHMAQLEALGLAPIDLVAINLYPFRATVERAGVTLEQAVENIDIGGPTMLRAAAKNYQDVAVLVDPNDYGEVLQALQAGGLTLEKKAALARKVFAHTAAYDALIADWLAAQAGEDPLQSQTFTRTYEKLQDLRYGENPHQAAAFYRELGRDLSGTVAAARQLQGKELSFNNINDAAGALALLSEFEGPAVVAVKHANPCGVGLADDIAEAYRRAYASDPVSIFGGIVAANREVSPEMAQLFSEIFLEIVVAPAFSQGALTLLSKKKNLRLLELPGLLNGAPAGGLDLKRVAGGLLVQGTDDVVLREADLRVVTDRAPSEAELEQLKFAFTVVKHVRSNGIVLASGGATVGIGPGQTNRVTALELAIRYAGDRVAGSVMGSDAFFPFPDCVEAAHRAGITAIIQPGGSVNDKLSIEKCNEYGIAMVFTGLRHFKH
ncbi:MAG: bifunctional phosphoribosylaminoimidazolecarboxamide formyltransferase/IMP cyclohydrolase [Clostridiales bacterium]|nr:bifunctional phosphoribosylaminoimidazolecarboxamide formyltransferase/IMP cyclohydrolase [Clostridiales bacterium]